MQSIFRQALVVVQAIAAVMVYVEEAEDVHAVMGILALTVRQASGFYDAIRLIYDIYFTVFHNSFESFI